MIPQTIVNQVEKKGISLLISRIRSKSPALYRYMQIWGASLAALFSSVVLTLQSNPALFTHENIVLELCKALAALCGGMALAASTTTTDPKLVSKELKNNIITDATPIGPPVDAG